MNERKEHVIEVAKQLFATIGFNETSMQDIIDTCSISKGTFYNYFTSKNAFLIAYMSAAQREENKRRNDLLQFHNKTDKEVFAKQIIVRLDVKLEFTLRPIYEMAFHAEDTHLKKYMQSRFMEELTWLSERLIEIYGKQFIPHIADAAIIIHGMIQNTIYTWKLVKKQQVNFTHHIQFIIRRLDSLMLDLKNNNDVLFDTSSIPFIQHKQRVTEEKSDIIIQLLHLKREYTMKEKMLHEYVQFLLDEIRSETIRKHIMFITIDEMIKITKDHPYEQSFTHVLERLKQYLTHI